MLFELLSITSTRARSKTYKMIEKKAYIYELVFCCRESVNKRLVLSVKECFPLKEMKQLTF